MPQVSPEISGIKTSNSTALDISSMQRYNFLVSASVRGPTGYSLAFLRSYQIPVIV